MKVGAINLSIEAKSKRTRENYRKLFAALCDLRMPVKYSGERRLLLAGSSSDIDEDSNELIGDLHAFTDIKAAEWFNVEAQRAASPTERNEIVVPGNMRANWRPFPALFNIRSHHLVFVTYEASKGIPIKRVASVFEALVSQPSIFKKFGVVNVTVEQEPEPLGNILNAKQLRWLSITIKRPNSMGGLDEDWDDQMNAVRSGTYREEYGADERGGIRPNKAMRDAAAVALSNGVVEARVFKDGSTDTVSTKDFPVSEKTLYDPDNETRINALKRVARAMLSRIAQRLQ